MAIAIRWSAASTNGSGTCTVTKQTTVAGDLLVMALACPGATVSLTLSPPTGWSKVARADGTTFVESSSTVFSIFYRIADGTEGSSFVFPSSSTYSTNGYMTCFSGVDTTTPFDVGAPAATSSTASLSISPPAITTVTANAWVVKTANHKTSSTTFTSSTGPTKIGESPHAHVFYETTTTAGTVTAKALTAAASGNYAGNTIALRPSATDTTPPGPVTGASASASSSTQIDLSWTNPGDSDFAGVMIRRAVGATAPTDTTSGTLVTTTSGSTSSFSDTTVSQSTQYTYALFAKDAIPNYASAGTATATTPATPDTTAPGAVTSLGQTHTDTSVTLSWTNPADSDFAGVMIRRAAGGSPPATISSDTLVTNTSGSTATFTDTSLSPSTQYSYSVFAKDAVPNYSAATSITTTTSATPDTTPPAAVSGVSESHTSTTITLSWTNPADADFSGVMIRRATGATPPPNSSSGTLVTDTTGSTATFTDSVLSASTQYSYALFAHDPVPNYASGTNLTVTTSAAADTTPPGPVTGVGETHTNNSVTLSWTNPSDSDFAGVMIRRATGATAPASASAGTLVTDTSGSTATFTDTGRSATTQYSYALFAHDATPNYSTAVNQTVTTSAPPGSGNISGLVVNTGLTGISFSWTNPVDVGFAGVMVRYATGATPPANATAGTLVSDVAAPGTTVSKTSLTSNTQYSFAFFAHDGTPTYASGVTATTTTLPDVSAPAAQTKKPVIAHGPHKISSAGIPVPLAKKSRQGERSGYMPGPNLVTRVLHPHVSYSDGVVTAHMSRVRHKVLVDGYDLRLVYANYEQGSATNPITVTAAVEILPTGGTGTAAQSGSTFLQCTFAGQSSVTIPANQTAITDPVPWEFVKDQYFCTRNYVTVTSGDKFPVCLWFSGTGEGREENGTDKTTTGSVSLGTFQQLYAPANASLTPTAETMMVGLPGDSILATESPLCAVEQVLEKAYIPYLNMARIGEAINANWLSTQSRYRRMKMMNQCTHIISNYGVNDLNSGRTASQLQGDLLAFWKLFSVRGMRVFHNTITPKTTSTDNFTSIANQTAFSGEAGRVTVNNWLRDGAPIDATTLAAVATGTSTNVLRAGASGHPLIGVFDTATTVESSLNSGKWKLDSVQSDGLHPNANGQSRMQSAIDVSKLVLAI